MFKNLTPLYFFLKLSYIGILLSSLLISSLDSLITLSGIFLVTSTFSFTMMIIDKRRGGVSYMYEFFILFFIALPSFVQIKNQIFPWFAKFEVEHLSLAYALLSVSQIGYLSGQYIFHRQLRKRQEHKKNVEINFVSLSRWAWFVAFLSVIFAIFAGPSNLVVSRFGREGADFSGLTEQFLFIARSLSLLAFIIVLTTVLNTSLRKVKKQNIFFGLAFLIPFLLINFPPALPRFILFGIVIAISTFFYNYFNTKSKLIASIFSSLVLFLIFPVIKALGHGSFNLNLLEERLNLKILKDYLLRVDFDAFMQIASTISYLEIGGDYRYGNNFLGVALFLIPRFIWESKPIPSGYLVSEKLGFEYGNVSSPLMAEALLGFGLIGPLLVFSSFAILISHTEHNYGKKLKSQSITLSSIYYPLYMAFITIILRGSLNAVAAQFATAILVLIVINYTRRYKIKINN